MRMVNMVSMVVMVIMVTKITMVKMVIINAMDITLLFLQISFFLTFMFHVFFFANSMSHDY